MSALDALLARAVFRASYPRGENFVVAPHVANRVTTGGLQVPITGLKDLRQRLAKPGAP